jgi:GT2 family glycosyltransferase
MPELSAVILSYNTRALLQECIETLLRAATGLDLELIVVDNGSTDGSRSFLESLGGGIRLILSDDNLGFAGGNNAGMGIATAPVVLLLNSDAFVTAETLHAALAVLSDQPQVGLVGVRILNPDGSVQAESGSFPSLWQDILTSLGIERHKGASKTVPKTTGPVEWVHGACMFARASALASAGGLDERFFMYSEEVDWCRRFWEAGWEVWYLPETCVVHIGGASSGSNDLGRRVALYRSRLGLRRRLDGPLASLLLWTVMLGGFTARIATRPLLQAVLRRRIGRQSARADWQLLCAVARMDPLARFAAR